MYRFGIFTERDSDSLAIVKLILTEPLSATEWEKAHSNSRERWYEKLPPMIMQIIKLQCFSTDWTICVSVVWLIYILLFVMRHFCVHVFFVSGLLFCYVFISIDPVPLECAAVIYVFEACGWVLFFSGRCRKISSSAYIYLFCHKFSAAEADRDDINSPVVAVIWPAKFTLAI